MKFIVGVAAGAVLGAIGAIVYAGQTDTDLREVFKQWQTGVSSIDTDEIGARVQEGVATAQATIQQRANEVRGMAAPVADEVTEAADNATAATNGSSNGVAAEAAPAEG